MILLDKRLLDLTEAEMRGLLLEMVQDGYLEEPARAFEVKQAAKAMLQVYGGHLSREGELCYAAHLDDAGRDGGMCLPDGLYDLLQEDEDFSYEVGEEFDAVVDRIESFRDDEIANY